MPCVLPMFVYIFVQGGVVNVYNGSMATFNNCQISESSTLEVSKTWMSSTPGYLNHDEMDEGNSIECTVRHGDGGVVNLKLESAAAFNNCEIRGSSAGVSTRIAVH